MPEKSEYRLCIYLHHDNFWFRLERRSVIFGLIPINNWGNYSLPSNNLNFLKKYLTIEKIKNLRVEFKIKE